MPIASLARPSRVAYARSNSICGWRFGDRADTAAVRNDRRGVAPVGTRASAALARDAILSRARLRALCVVARATRPRRRRPGDRRVPRRARPFRAAARRDRQLLLVLARRERRRPDGAASADAGAPAALPSRD